MDQAERRFVSFGSIVWVGTALSADWMRPYALTASIARFMRREGSREDAAGVQRPRPLSLSEGLRGERILVAARSVD